MITIVFRGRVDVAHLEELEPMGRRMYELGSAMPGFLEYKQFAAEDGEVLTLIRFESLEAIRAWREHAEHRVAIHNAYRGWMHTYDISVCEVIRQYTRESRQRDVAGGAPEPGSVPVWDPAA